MGEEDSWAFGVSSAGWRGLLGSWGHLGEEAGWSERAVTGTVTWGCWSDMSVAGGCLRPDLQGEVRAGDKLYQFRH